MSRIITGDETWVHNFTSESKLASIIWKRSNSPTTIKFKVVPSAGKVMATVFFDCQGVVYTEFMPKRTTINALSYCRTLENLKKAIKDRTREKLSEGIILLHDNVTPHGGDYTGVASKIQLGGMATSSIQSRFGPLRLPFVSKTDKRNRRQAISK